MIKQYYKSIGVKKRKQDVIAFVMKNPAQTGSGCISDDMGITATMNKLRHRVYKCNDVLFTFFLLRLICNIV
jgi:hypothetical protein